MDWNRRAFLNVTGLAAGSGLAGLALGRSASLFAQAPAADAALAPDIVLNPIEVTGADAVPIVGRLPGLKRMYMLPADQGEFHQVGTQIMKRISRPAETDGVHELVTFTGRTGAGMPRHVHLSSHAALLVMSGEVEVELAGQRWILRRGDFANIPPGTPHAWTMRSDAAQIALFTMNDRVGKAFVAMGSPAASGAVPTGGDHAIPGGKLADAAFTGDFQVAPPAPAGTPQRVSNLVLPAAPGPYVIADGGGERFGGNSFLARNANTGGQFLFIITEGGPGPGVGAHFHARHFENFFALDGETLGWANGKAVALKTGDYFQAPPRHLHGFKLTQGYNRFAAFLTPGIFENFFTRGGNGQNGVPRDAAAAGAPRGAGPGGAPGGGAARGGRPAGGGDMFRQLMMSGRGPDGYPLDVHGATAPLPPQDPVWTQASAGDTVQQRAALLAHAQAICGVPVSREITPELKRALALKPKAEDFI